MDSEAGGTWKLCPECGKMAAVSALTCPSCGHLYPIEEPLRGPAPLRVFAAGALGALVLVAAGIVLYRATHRAASAPVPRPAVARAPATTPPSGSVSPSPTSPSTGFGLPIAPPIASPRDRPA